MVWRLDLDSSHAESQKIAHLLVPYTRGRGIDAGAGPNPAFMHFTTVDNGKDFGGRKVADIHADASDLSFLAPGSQDFVFSSHFLEHVTNPLVTLKSWWAVIRTGGNLVLYLPHADLYPRIGQPGANPDHKSDFVPDDIIKLMGMVALQTGQGWLIRENEVRGDDDEYSFFMVFEKRADDRTLGSPWQRNPDGKPRCLVIRYGAIGDAIQTTSIFPGLKAKGWHVTVNTTPGGHEVMRENPHVDEWLLQDTDQVPNGLLLAYWLRLGERYDHIINLSGSIEDGLLPHPERDVAYFWPAEARRRVFGPVNYLERLHDIADVPHDFAQRFYPGADLAAAQKEIRDMRGPQQRPVVLWALAGSGVHKSWPYVHMAAFGLLTYSAAAIVFTGDAMCRDLEEAIGHHLIEMAGEDPAQLDGQPREELQKAMDRLYPGRVLFASGRWPIRHTLACAQLADVVVGPETGVLNAVGLEANHKVVFLSHSSADNLTKHWKNTTALTGNADCYPCHRLHFGWEHCQQDKDTGAAACASRIGPQRVVEAVITALNERQGKAA